MKLKATSILLASCILSFSTSHLASAEPDQDSVAELQTRINELKTLTLEKLLAMKSGPVIKDAIVAGTLDNYRKIIKERDALIHSGLGERHPKVKWLSDMKKAEEKELYTRITEIRGTLEALLGVTLSIENNRDASPIYPTNPPIPNYAPSREYEHYLCEQIREHPEVALSYNTLGVLLFQRGGRQAEVISLLRMAITLDPDNGTYYFNLAVVFATSQPPNKDLAQRFYREALRHGAEPDKSLEKLMDRDVARVDA